MNTDKRIEKMTKLEMLELLRESLANIESINQSKSKIDTQVQDINKINNHAQQFQSDISSINARIQQSKSTVDTQTQNINQTHRRICEGEQSVETQLNNLVKQFKNDRGEVDQTKGKIDTLKKEAEQTLKLIKTDLNSAATSHKLARAFSDKVEEYNGDSNKWTNWLLITLIVLILGFVGYTFYYPISTTDLKQIIIDLLSRLPFVIFPVWLMIFLGNRRAESKKLEESYKHKEVMARAFTGYKDAIQGLDPTDKELLKKHMNNLLVTMNNDSSRFLNTKGDKHPFMDIFSRDKKKTDEEK